MAFSFEPFLAISAGHFMAVSAGPEHRFRTLLSKSVPALFVFPLYFGLFSPCPFYGAKAKLLKTEEYKIDRSPYIDRSLSFFAAIFGLKLRWRKISKKRVYQCFLHSFRLDSIPAPWYNTAVRNLFLGLNQNIL